MMRLERDAVAVDAMIRKCMAGLPSSFELTSALLALHPERESSVKDLTPCLAYARQVQSTGRPRYEGPAAKAEGWPDDEDFRRQEKWIEFDNDVAARLELCLCVFGTFVSIIARDGLVEPGTPLAGAVAVERARHLAHREEERRERLVALDRAIANARVQLKTSGTSEVLQRVLAANEAVRQKVLGLDDVTLCTDRCAF